jgi:adenylosuccinate lyase
MFFCKTEDSMPDFDHYLSPFSWRYGSDAMRHIWSETYKRRVWRKIWFHLAEIQSQYSLVTTEQVQEISQHIDRIDIQRAFEIEAEIHHDLMAELKTFAEQCGSAGGILHFGATSMDIEDNADAVRIREALDLILVTLEKLLLAFADQIERYASTPIMAFTHLQPAEPSTLGYRLASTAQDLLEDWKQLVHIRASIRGKGFKGAVGTAATYVELLGAEQYAAFEDQLSERLGISFYPVTTQTYPRKQDYQVVSALSGLGGTIYKFAFDLRLLQSPPIGELSEPFGQKQVGSSAMPFKRNPIQSEKIDSLARALAQMPQVAWQNAAHSLLERTLDDSANRRSLLPEAFLITDEIVRVSLRIVENLNVNIDAIQRNMAAYAPFAATERLLMGLVQAGADRQEMHEVLRQHALTAWQSLQQGQPNVLAETVAQDPILLVHLPADRIAALMQIGGYTGIAEPAARELAQSIRQSLQR